MQHIFGKKDYELLFKKFSSVENRMRSKLNIHILGMMLKDHTIKINTCVWERQAVGLKSRENICHKNSFTNEGWKSDCEGRRRGLQGGKFVLGEG